MNKYSTVILLGFLGFILERADIDCVKAAVKRVVSQPSPNSEATSPAGCGCKSCC